MLKMRVFLLALDGLEYNLVKKYRLKNIMQKQYGYIEIPQEYFVETKVPWSSMEAEAVPYTPTIWATILTGLKPREHKIRHLLTYGRLLERIRYLPVISWVKGKRRLLEKIGIKRRIVSKTDLKAPTIFDAVNPSVAVWFPCYNMPTWLWEIMAREARTNVSKIPRAVWKVFRLRRKKVFAQLGKKWKLFGAYFETLDWLGHLYYVTRPLKLMNAYLVFDALVGELKRWMPEDTVFLIVSDHGMEPSSDGVTGNHSRRAFWSLNIDTEWEPKDFTDFYPKIIKWVENKNSF
ncbi:hypothetical protein DRJ19_00600 [Candidatus Woesearchaeota archaeon]|nr:MAG: hypothetical protein DRJ19_00600 [Candidatus Woesearchaeota archaeon]